MSQHTPLGRLGVVGLGSMGSAMAHRLLDRGTPLAVYNRTAANAQPFRARGAEVLACPSDVAKRASIVITCVTDEHAVGQVLLGPHGVLQGAAPGTILLETSTIAPDASAGFAPACAEAGVAYLRAPISGSVAQAATGSLAFLVSGPSDAFETARPALDLLAAQAFYLGPGEEARAQKLALLLVVGATMAAVSEALVLGEKAGLDWRSMLEVFASSAVASPLVRTKLPTLVERDFAPGAATRLLAKDFDLILGAGRSTGTPLPLAGLVRQLLAAAMSGGEADLDFSALVLVFERLAALRAERQRLTTLAHLEDHLAMTITTPESARPASVATATTRRTPGAETQGMPVDLDVVHAGPGTLAGRYLRQFWQPVAVATDVEAGAARTIRVLGEEFTLYRGQSGTPFLVDHRCAHRGAQLSVGWVEDDCLRCLYHGWKYDSSGQCVEQIAEDPRFAAKVRIRAYPTQERLGLIFAYLGEGEAPAFPNFPAYDVEGELEVWVELYPCNYFQVWENTADEFHVAWVHSGGGTHRHLAEVPQMFAEETPYGIERRSRRPNGKVRVTQHLMPNCTRVIVPPFKGLVGAGGWRDSYFWMVPQDDENCLFFGIQQVQIAPEERDAYRARYAEFLRASEVGRPYSEVALDILAGKRRLADYVDHPQSAHIEDMVAQAGQARIQDRTNERLGRTDVGVILMRKLWSRELRALLDGKPLTTWRYSGEAPETGI